MQNYEYEDKVTLQVLRQSYYISELYEGWNFNSGNSLFTTDTK